MWLNLSNALPLVNQKGFLHVELFCSGCIYQPPNPLTHIRERKLDKTIETSRQCPPIWVHLLDLLSKRNLSSCSPGSSPQKKTATIVAVLVAVFRKYCYLITVLTKNYDHDSSAQNYGRNSATLRQLKESLSHSC